MFRLSLTLMVLTLPACLPSKEVAAHESMGTPVELLEVGSNDLVRTVTYGADIQASAEVQLFTTVSDRILSFPFEDGDLVSKGDRIALIKRDTLDRGIEQIAAQIEGLDIQIRTQELDLKRSKELLSGGVITQQIYDQAEAGLEANKAQRRALQASLAQVSLNAGEASVRAPVSGVLAKTSVDVGDRSSPQLALGSILVLDPLEVKLDLSEADARQVRSGQAVWIEVDAWPGERFEASVSKVYPYLDSIARTNTVELELPNPKAEDGSYMLKPGMFGRAELITEQLTQVPVVPQEALLIDSLLLSEAEPGQELRKAFVVADGIAHERKVELGMRSGELYEVRSGLEPGEQLVVRGQHMIKDGDRVSSEGRSL